MQGIRDHCHTSELPLTQTPFQVCDILFLKKYIQENRGILEKTKYNFLFLYKSFLIEVLICNIFWLQEGGPHERAEIIDPSAFWILCSFFGLLFPLTQTLQQHHVICFSEKCIQDNRDHCHTSELPLTQTPFKHCDILFLIKYIYKKMGRAKKILYFV